MYQKELKKMHLIIAVLVSMGLLAGCAGRVYAPKEPSIIWYYHKELPEADKAVAEAQKAGKDKECPAEFNAARALKEKAYETYWSCWTLEAIELAKEATAKANALCPPKPIAAEKPSPATQPEPVSDVKPPLTPEPKPVTKPEPKMIEEQVIVLKDIHFDFDKATLTAAAKKILKTNTRTMKDHPDLKIRIEGHACAHGAEAYNLALSERRALAVKEYLVKEGIKGDRLSTISYGKTRLLLPEIPTPKNKNSKEAKANRRVHFELIK